MENIEIAKYLLVLVTAPIWWPVMKALWLEANRMLVEDGGVLGRPPSSRQVEQRRQELEELGDPLVHEPLATEDQRRAARRRLGAARPARRAGKGAQPGSAARPPRPGPRATGFR